MEAAAVKGPLKLLQAPVSVAATVAAVERNHVLHTKEQTRLSVLWYNPCKHNVDSVRLLQHLCVSFHVLVSHEAGELEKLLDNEFWVNNEDEGNIIVAVKKSTFKRMKDREVMDHEVVHSESGEVRSLEAVSLTVTAPLLNGWRGDENSPGPLVIRIAAVRAHRLSINACADTELLADFARHLCNLVADIICVNPGPLDLRVLLKATTTTFWSSVQPATCNVAFLFRKDTEFAKHSRLQEDGLVHMAKIAGPGSVGALHIAARTVPPSMMRSSGFTMNQTPHWHKGRRQSSREPPSVASTTACVEAAGIHGDALLVPANPPVPPPPPPPPLPFWHAGAVGSYLCPTKLLLQGLGLQPGPPTNRTRMPPPRASCLPRSEPYARCAC